MDRGEVVDKGVHNLSIAFDILTSLGKSENLEELCLAFLTRVTEKFQMLGGEFWVIDDNRVQKVASIGKYEPGWSVDEEIGRLENTTRFVIYRRLSRMKKAPAGVDVFLLPLKFRGDLVGVPVIYIQKGRKLSNDEEWILSSIKDILTNYIVSNIVCERASESERFQSMLLDTIGAGIIIHKGGVVRYVNKAVEKIGGYTREEWEGKDIIQFVHPDDRDIVMDVLKRRGEGDDTKINLNLRVITKSGVVKWVNLTSNLITYKGERVSFLTGVDITELKEVEEALAKSEKHYRALFENASLPISITDSKRRFVEVNRAFEELFGYTRDEVKGKDISVILYKGVEDKVAKIHDVRRVAPHKAPETYEIITVTKSQIPRVVRVTSRMLPDSDMDITFLQDVTREKEMIIALEESEERYRTLAEVSQVGIMIFSDEQVLFRNQHIDEIFGDKANKPDEIFKQISAEDRGAFIGAYQKVLSGKSDMETLELKVIKEGGAGSIFVEAKIVPVVYRNKRYVLANIIDITMLRRAMANLIASEMKYRVLVENLPVGIAIHSEKSIIFCNRAFEEIVGYGFDELKKMKMRELVAEADLETLRNRMKFILDGVIRSYKKEVQLKSSMCEDVFVFLSMNRIYFDSKPAVLLGIIDITDRKKAEEALKKAHEEIKRSHQELKKLDAAKTEFLNIISHELKTPLTSVIGYTEILQDGLLGSISPAQKEAIKSLHISSRRLSSLVDDLLDYSRIELGKLTMTKERSDLNDIIQQSINEVNPIAVDKGITITFNRKQIPELLLDRHRINQLMNNILSNAIKFSPSNSEVFIIEIPKDDEVEIIVKDEGPGIPKEKLKRIFDKFYQADMSDRRSTMGMGLGLAISKAIVEGHGGSIWAESEVGKGSAFHFTLKYINRQ